MNTLDIAKLLKEYFSQIADKLFVVRVNICSSVDPALNSSL